MNTRADNMRMWATRVVAVLVLVDLAAAYDGVKGGSRRPPSYPSHDLVAFPASENGTCYKRLTYHDAVAANTTGHIHIVPGSHHEDTKQGGSNWVTVVDCCDGFTRDPVSGRCETRCESGCQGGRCTGPNICTCEDGWLPEGGICKPYCRRPCKPNAYCFSPDVCECKLGYEDVYGQCKPICPGDCRNGECVAPRVCRCRPGYVLNEQKECLAVCEGGCPHGECTSPGTCTCNPGYSNPPGDRESCVPDSQITCEQGQTRDESGRCVPSNQLNQQVCLNQWDICLNGRCVGPNQCVCDPGYVNDPRTQKCVSSHSQTDYPTTTPTSHLYPTLGYQMCQHRGDTCPNGQCVGLNHCVCNHGFRKDSISPICVPDLDYGPRILTTTPPSHYLYPTLGNQMCQYRGDTCPNGQCAGLHHCACNPGYTNDPRTNICVPTYNHGDQYSTTTPPSSHQSGQLCQTRWEECPNGECVGVNRCRCNPGFVNDPRTQICVRAYNTDSHSTPTPDNFNRPSHYCPNGCPNGRCVGHYQCECNPGFAMNQRTQTCTLSDNSNSDSWGSHGTGVPPSRNSYSSAQCRDGCPNGMCVEMNVCVCHPGYIVNPVTRTCTRNGTTGNDYGSHGNVGGVIGLDNTCERPCLNGECTGHNTCTCNRGYTNDAHDPYKCIPVCHGGCPNGVCTAPNYCICNQGYIKDRSVKGVQRCVPQY